MHKYIIILIIATLLQGVISSTGIYYPASIKDVTSTHSTQSISVLSVNDQSGSTNTWANYVEFSSSSKAYSGIFNFKYSFLYFLLLFIKNTFGSLLIMLKSIGSAQSISSMTLKVNYMGQAWSFQKWTFSVYLNPTSSSSSSWVQIGDSSSETSGWSSWKYVFIIIHSLPLFSFFFFFCFL